MTARGGTRTGAVGPGPRHRFAGPVCPPVRTSFVSGIHGDGRAFRSRESPGQRLAHRRDAHVVAGAPGAGAAVAEGGDPDELAGRDEGPAGVALAGVDAARVEPRAGQ